MTNRFDTFVFPPYDFKEYPKWVKGADGKDVLVHSADEEVIAVEGAREAPEAFEHPIDAPEDGEDGGPSEREQLLQEAEEMGVSVKPNWAISRLRREIEKHRA